MDIGDLGPQVFDWVVEIPRVGEGSTIAFQFLWCHRAILAAEMLQHGKRRNIAKSEIGILQSAQERSINSGEDLGSERRAKVRVQRHVGEGLRVCTDSHSNGSGSAGGDRGRAWVEGYRKSDSDPSDIISVGEEEGQMAVKSTAAGGWDRASVSEQLALQ